jgi:ABC-type phosphate/phosphonate transport system ATPase subunit
VDGLDIQLKDINFEIKRGEFVAIIGAYGSGKSSLINSLLGEMKY